ncbi:unnamed protein product [Mycena citricolor]|uniref:Uncharacterized protein n=1 Tax=Mycena citricolor TaxID=2018698 RepID=A0AAD2Q580_9AGAR|nr:unnamed protein product [Mycena citricolor]
MPIIFLPHADTLEHDSLHWLKLAFALAFADIEGAVERIAGLQSLNDLILFSRNNSKQLYFLVDGFDLVADDLKATIYSLVSNHFLVYTTYQLAGRISLSIRLPSKFSEQDVWKWMEHYENDFPSSMTMQNRLFLKYITGGIPAHLQAMREFRGQAFKEIVSKFRQCHKMQALADDVTAFHSRMESLKSADRKRYLQLVTACLTDTIPEIRHGSHPTLYDPRYFCFDDEGRGCCASGLARDIMINLLYAEDMSLFTSDSWYSSVRSACGLIRDSSIIQICLGRIALSGLFHANANGTAMRISTFRETPAFGWMFEEARKNPRGTSSFLCIPGPDTCRFFTAVIVRINPVDKTAHLIPLQISVSQTCTDLATSFFAVTWHGWGKFIRDEGFKTINTFVLVDSLTSESAETISNSNTFREGVRVRIFTQRVLDSRRQLTAFISSFLQITRFATSMYLLSIPNWVVYSSEINIKPQPPNYSRASSIYFHFAITNMGILVGSLHFPSSCMKPSASYSALAALL